MGYKIEGESLASVDKTITLGDKEQDVFKAINGGEWKKYARVAMAALSAVPAVGSFIGAMATFSGEDEQGKTNELIYLWIREHEIKLKDLKITLDDIFKKFESFGDRIEERIESDEYISLVRKTFKVWDQSETLEKKEMLKKMIINAAGITISQDDLVRMFFEWIDKYHEFHFAVISEIYKHPMITRGKIWKNIKGDFPRDDSSEAHLFRLLINDLNSGEVIGQFKHVNNDGDYLKNTPQKRNPTDTRISPFDDTKPYVLTNLGSDFVHYAMKDLAPQIENK